METQSSRSESLYEERTFSTSEVSSEVTLAEIITSLSAALDITEGQPPGHAARTCVLAMRFAGLLQLNEEETEALFYAALLKDLGCSSNAAKMCYLFAADDRTLKRDVKTINWQKLTDNFRYAKRNVRPGAGTLQRVMQLASLAVQGAGGPQQLVKIRCERGAEIVRRLKFPESTAQAILHLDEHFNGRGYPLGLEGESISLLGRILCLCQTFEVFWREQGLAAALDVARSRSGTWFDPKLVAALESIVRDRDFCNSFLSDPSHKPLSRLLPWGESRLVSGDELDQIALAFSEVVDAKSPWTHRHSIGVAEIAAGIGECLDFSPMRLQTLHRAALLHDIGKLGVSNLILDKPGKLTADELASMQRHPEFSEIILSPIATFSKIARFAGAHHEKLDGSGYFRGTTANELDAESRILTVSDIFEALTAARPYREGMPQEKVIELLRRDAGKGICPVALSGLLKWLDRRCFESRVDEQIQAMERNFDELKGCESCQVSPRKV